LFVADSPTTPEQFAQAMGVPVREVEEALEKLGGRYHHDSALQIIKIAGGYQICTKPEHADAIARFAQPQRNRLSRSLLETLAVVAYQQPVTLAEIDAVRGVDSSYAVRQLTERRLVTEVGRRPTPGRPTLFGTTQQFLHTFRLDSLDDLPPLDQALPVTVGESQPPVQPALELQP
jgi:segregation and condensation protein B